MPKRELSSETCFGSVREWAVWLSFSFARYDPRHNRWFQIQSLQREHADLCVCVVGDSIYAVAGRDYREDLREVERYDPHTNTWDYVAPLKKEVRGRKRFDTDGLVYWKDCLGPHQLFTPGVTEPL